MPYIIAAVVVVIGAVAFMVFRSPAEAPTIEPTVEQTAQPTTAPAPGEAPEGFVEPTTPPPAAENGAEGSTDGAAQTPDTADAGATGSFTGEASYSTGRAVHELDVTLTLADDVVTAVDITYDGLGEPQTPALRNFNEAYEPEVIGKNIDEINLSRVGGASWTSDAFNEAVAEIRGQL